MAIRIPRTPLTSSFEGQEQAVRTTATAPKDPLLQQLDMVKDVLTIQKAQFEVRGLEAQNAALKARKASIEAGTPIEQADQQYLYDVGKVTEVIDLKKKQLDYAGVELESATKIKALKNEATVRSVNLILSKGEWDTYMKEISDPNNPNREQAIQDLDDAFPYLKGQTNVQKKVLLEDYMERKKLAFEDADRSKSGEVVIEGLDGQPEKVFSKRKFQLPAEAEIEAGKQVKIAKEKDTITRSLEVYKQGLKDKKDFLEGTSQIKNIGQMFGRMEDILESLPEGVLGFSEVSYRSIASRFRKGTQEEQEMIELASRFSAMKADIGQVLRVKGGEKGVLNEGDVNRGMKQWPEIWMSNAEKRGRFQAIENSVNQSIITNASAKNIPFSEYKDLLLDFGLKGAGKTDVPATATDERDPDGLGI